MIKSKYKPTQLIISVFFGILFVIAPFFFFKDSGHKLKSGFLLLLLPLIGIFLLYSFFKKCPRIVFDEGFIKAKYIFGSKTYDWSSVMEVFLSRKEMYLGQSVEATVMVFNNQDKLVLWQDMYSNIVSIRKYIVQKTQDKIRDTIPDVKVINLGVITGRRYSGNIYTSFNTLLLLGMAAFFFISIKPIKPEPALLIPVGLLLILYCLFGTQMNYFVIDDGCLIVKNHYFPWKSRRLDLREIVEVNIESPYRRSDGLRILMKNFKSNLYGAGSLRAGNWNELLNDLKLIGIPARDDR